MIYTHVTHGLSCTRILARSYGRSIHNVLQLRMVSLQVSAQHSQMDDPLGIQVTGLSPGQPITLAAMVNAGKMPPFLSYAHYTTSEKGQVDLHIAESHGGSFTGVEPMGLFWSLKSENPEGENFRLQQKDVTKPHLVKLSVLDGHVAADSPDVHVGQTLAQTELERAYMADGVQRVPFREGALRGTLFIPNEGHGQYPGVLDLYGTGGGLAEYRAALLASRGFTTLALAYFKYDDLPQTIDVPLEYFEEAIERLSNHRNVCPGGLGCIGLSKGGEISLYSLLLSDKVKAAVAVNAYYYVSMGNHTYRGEKLEAVWPEYDKMVMGKNGAELRAAFNTSSEHQHAAVPIEQKPKDSHLLLIAGEDDKLCDCINTAILVQKLRLGGQTNFSAHIFEGAGHLIEPPYMPHCLHSRHPMGVDVNWGGEMKLHAHAQLEAWQMILSFFRKNLPSGTNL